MTAARKTFFAAKERKMYYRTMEIWQDGGILLRYVSGRIDPKSFKLEANAPRNAGEEVEFLGGYFEYQLPDQNDSKSGADISLGRVGSQVKRLLKELTPAQRTKPGEVVLREYVAGNELIGPDYVLRLYTEKIALTAENVIIKIGSDNPAARGVAMLFNPEVFPGLQESL